MSILRRWGQPWSHGDAMRVNHATIRVVTPPAQEPVTRAEVARWLRITYTTDDPILDKLIVAARQRVEQYLRRALITQTIEFTLDWGPAWVELPMPPLQSVTSITVVALDNTISTASPASYFVRPGQNMVGLNPASVWPTHLTPAGWKCTYVAGYGNDPSDVPANIQLAIWNMCAYAYDNRGQMREIDGDSNLVNLLESYRLAGQPFRIAKGIEPPELLA